jgi:hypothetical protein
MVQGKVRVMPLAEFRSTEEAGDQGLPVVVDVPLTGGGYYTYQELPVVGTGEIVGSVVAVRCTRFELGPAISLAATTAHRCSSAASIRQFIQLPSYMISIVEHFNFNIPTC